MKKKLLTCTMLLTALFSACTSSEETTSGQKGAVRIKTTIGSLTRTSPATGEATTFNSGDVISVSDEQKEVAYTYDADAGEWLNATDFLTWDTAPKTFRAFYPANVAGQTYATGNIQADQTTAEAIAKSDYMKVEKTVNTIPANNTLSLNMERQTARVIINIVQFNNQFPEGTRIDHMLINTNKQLGGTSTDKIDVQPYVVAGNEGEGAVGTSYTALVAPGDAQVKVYFAADDANPLTAPVSGLEKGKSYTYNFIVGKNKIEIAKVTVEEWTDGEIPGGKADEEQPDPTPYITFTAESEQKFKMNTKSYTITGFEYSVKGSQWKELTSTYITFGGANGALRIRGKNLKGTATSAAAYACFYFSNSSVPVACTGDIRTLLDYENYTTVETKDAKFCHLFDGCQVLTSAPELPAMTLADQCYENMFQNCSSLIEAPALPARTLKQYCYSNMFFGCAKLTQAPQELPAEELAANCYSHMFRNCTKLEIAPELPATSLNDYCYYMMFNGCTSLSSVTILAPSDQIKNDKGEFYYAFGGGAGEGATTRILRVKDKAAYDALKVLGSSNFSTKWQIGNCAVIDEDGNAITE